MRKIYPNRDALRDANDIYLDTMRSFIVRCLKQVSKEKEEPIETLVVNTLPLDKQEVFRRNLEETGDIESAIDYSYFPHIIAGHWYGCFDREFGRDLVLRNMPWIVREGRNKCEHRHASDMDADLVRANLFLIAAFLEKIGKSEEQRVVETIREGVIPHNIQEKFSAYEGTIASLKGRLATDEETEARLQKQIETKDVQLAEKEKSRNKLVEQVLGIKKERDAAKTQRTNLSKRLTKAEKMRDTFEEQYETASLELMDAAEELAKMRTAHAATVAQLETVKKLLSMTTLRDDMFPSVETDSAVRMLDRRGVSKKNYLRRLLAQEQPTIIYVNREEMLDAVQASVLPEGPDVIGKCGRCTSEAEEMEIWEKLQEGQLLAVVSSTLFFTSRPAHRIKHFVFYHLVPGVELFFKQCQPAFESEQDTYLHLLYNAERDMTALNRHYPNRDVLKKMYRESKRLRSRKRKLIKAKTLHKKLDMEGASIETGLAIFEELQLIKRKADGIKFVCPPDVETLRESEIYRKGEQLKKGMQDFYDFQNERSIAQMWEACWKRLT